MNVAAFILGAIALLGASAAALPPIWNFFKAMSKLLTIVERINEEFSPNSGSTMRDSVDRQERALAEHITQYFEFREYCHLRFHEILNHLTVVGGAQELLRELHAVATQLRESHEEHPT